jgi:hypothetical protein
LFTYSAGCIDGCSGGGAASIRLTKRFSTHSFPSAGDNGATLHDMQIEFTVQEPSYRTGTLTGVTQSQVQSTLPGIQPDTRTSADRKLTLIWRFLVDGKPCGIWNYRHAYELRGEFSTFGPDAAFETLFGKAYTSLQT